MGLIDHLALSIDFSPASEVAARAALRLAALTSAERMTILHATKGVVLPEGNQPKVRERLEKVEARLVEAASKQCNEMISKLTIPEGLTVDVKIVNGRPAEAIPDAAKEIGAGLLMIGSASRKGLQRWFKGSVAEAIIRRTEVPTLVLLTGHDGIGPDEELEKLRKVLIGVDLDPGCEQVVRVGVRLASAFTHVAPEVTLLTVTELPERSGLEARELSEFQETMNQVAQAQLAEMCERYNKDNLKIETVISDGEAKEKILDLAASSGAGLIVVGTHGRGSAPLIDIGSNTERVTRHADVAVLVVPCHPDQMNERM